MIDPKQQAVNRAVLAALVEVRTLDRPSADAVTRLREAVAACEEPVRACAPEEHRWTLVCTTCRYHAPVPPDLVVGKEDGVRTVFEVSPHVVGAETGTDYGPATLPPDPYVGRYGARGEWLQLDRLREENDQLRARVREYVRHLRVTHGCKLVGDGAKRGGGAG